MKEDHLEYVCLDWLGSLGWTCVSGDALAPGEGERERWSDVVLAPRLREVLVWLNPGVSAAEVEATVDRLSGYGAQSLVDGNRELYDWLRNGVPVDRVESDGRHTGCGRGSSVSME